MESERHDNEWLLEGLLADGKTWQVRIDPLPFLVGRSAECDLNLSARSVSRQHAELYATTDGLFTRDLGSKNGTWLNRRRLVREEKIRPGDVIAFGTVECRVVRRGAEASLDETGTEKVLRPPLLPYCGPDFEALLAGAEVFPLYQPIVRLEDKSRLGYEVVGRGRREGLPTMPMDLFEIAKHLGREAELSRLFWQKGLEGAEAFGQPVHLFINVHAGEISGSGLVEALEAARMKAPDLPLTVEISEKAVTDLGEMRRLRAALMSLNIRLAYDDFGAGQSRLLELIEVTPHFLKFDASLIAGLQGRPPRHLKMLEALVRMARELGITAVAEGVESPRDAEACTGLGFHYAQGYHFGRPGPALQYTAL